MTVINFPEKQSQQKSGNADEGLLFIAALMLDIGGFAEASMDNTYAVDGVPEHDLEVIRERLSAISESAASLRKHILSM